jgi:hypothetical protein
MNLVNLDTSRPPRLVVTIVPVGTTGITANLGVGVTHVGVVDLKTGQAHTTVFGLHHNTSEEEVVRHLVRRMGSEDPSWAYDFSVSFPLSGGRMLVYLY